LDSSRIIEDHAANDVGDKLRDARRVIEYLLMHQSASGTLRLAPKPPLVVPTG